MEPAARLMRVKGCLPRLGANARGVGSDKKGTFLRVSSVSARVCAAAVSRPRGACMTRPFLRAWRVVGRGRPGAGARGG